MSAVKGTKVLSDEDQMILIIRLALRRWRSYATSEQDIGPN
nr:hypothetical protein [uncultured Butyrivibrio sp.]